MKIWLIFFLLLMVSQNVQSQLRLVVNTTCLDLAKPANKQYRLTCSQDDYHCLLDETFTKEYEVCKKWKWIPGGKCAYYNTYQEGNIDQKPCLNSTTLVCPESAYFSIKTLNFTACYEKNITYTDEPTTKYFLSSSEGTQDITIDGQNSTSSPMADTFHKQAEITWRSCAILIGIMHPFLEFALICFCYRKRTNGSLQSQDQDNGLNDDVPQEQQQMIPIEQIPTRPNGTENNRLNDGEKETLVESPPHSCFEPAQSEYAEVDETAVELNGERCTEPTLDDEQLLHDSSCAVVTTNEAGKTVTEKEDSV